MIELRNQNICGDCRSRKCSAAAHTGAPRDRAGFACGKLHSFRLPQSGRRPLIRHPASVRRRGTASPPGGRLGTGDADGRVPSLRAQLGTGNADGRVPSLQTLLVTCHLSLLNSQLSPVYGVSSKKYVASESATLRAKARGNLARAWPTVRASSSPEKPMW